VESLDGRARVIEQLDVLRAKLASRTMRMAQDSAKKTRPGNTEMLHTPSKGKAAAATEGFISAPAAPPATPPQ
jgi:hypothetical protein